MATFTKILHRINSLTAYDSTAVAEIRQDINRLTPSGYQLELYYKLSSKLKLWMPTRALKPSPSSSLTSITEEETAMLDSAALNSVNAVEEPLLEQYYERQEIDRIYQELQRNMHSLRTLIERQATDQQDDFPPYTSTTGPPNLLPTTTTSSLYINTTNKRICMVVLTLAAIALILALVLTTRN